MNNINFKARLVPTNNAQTIGGRAFQDFDRRKENICKIFEENTKDSPNSILYIDNFRHLEAIYEENGEIQARHTFNTSSIRNPEDEIVAKRFLDIFDLMQLKAQQNLDIRKLKQQRKELDQFYQQMINEKEAKGENTNVYKQAQTMAFSQNSKMIASLKRIYDSDFESKVISKGLSDKF